MLNSLGNSHVARFAGETKHFLRLSQSEINIHCDRMCAAEDAPRGSLYILERSHGLVEIVERGAIVPV